MDFVGSHVGLYFFVILINIHAQQSLPVQGDISSRQGQWEYLKTYQHVPNYISTKARSASNPDDISFSAAVSAYQRFFQLHVNGRVDESTLTLMKQPRCSIPDGNENEREARFAIRSSGWKQNPLTYRLAVPPSGDAPNKCAARARLIQAFQVWQYAVQKDFIETDPAVTANIDASYFRGAHGDQSPFDGPGKTLAHAFFPYAGGDIHIDSDDDFSADLQPRNAHNLLMLYIHEIGHSLGLGHSNDKNAIMWPYIYKGASFRGLANDDISAARYLYGARQRPATGPDNQCTENTSGGTANGAKCVFPFTYKRWTFHECTTFRHNKKWCSTTSKYVGKWGNCIGCLTVSGQSSCRPTETEGTRGGTAYGAPCYFPFKYKGVIYHKCTSVDHRRAWCSTAPEYGECWGNCAGCEDQPQLSTCDETTRDGKQCIFPFFYHDKVYYACTKVKHYGPWCSHNTVYVGGWSDCNECN